MQTIFRCLTAVIAAPSARYETGDSFFRRSFVNTKQNSGYYKIPTTTAMVQLLNEETITVERRL